MSTIATFIPATSTELRNRATSIANGLKGIMDRADAMRAGWAQAKQEEANRQAEFEANATKAAAKKVRTPRAPKAPRAEGTPRKGGRAVNQLDLTTGAVLATFATITLAAAAIGKSTTVIGRNLSGELKSAGGFKWEYATAPVTEPTPEV